MLEKSVKRATARLAVLGGLRDLRYVFASTLVSELGDGIVSVALAFAVLDLTGSATDLGVIIASRFVAQVVVMLVGGVVADRLNRRVIMVAADLVRFAGQLTSGALLISGHATVLELAVSQMLIGAGGSFFIPASSGLLQTVAGDHLQESNALNVIASSGSAMLGPALGGALVVGIGAHWALVVDGATYLTSALLLLGMSRAAAAAVQHKAEPSTFLSDLRGGFGEVASRKWLWSSIISMMFANLFAGASPVLAPIICKQHYNGATSYAAMSVCFAVGMLIGGGALLRFKPRFPLRLGIIVGGPYLAYGILLGLHVPIPLVGLLEVTAGIGVTVSNALWWTAMQQNVPTEAMSRVISYEYAATLSIVPLGAALAGPFSHAIGASSALIVCCAAGIAIKFAALLVRDIRTLQAGSPPPRVATENSAS
jgi:MFS family permease